MASINSDEKFIDFKADLLTKEKERIVSVGGTVVAVLAIIIPISIGLTSQLFATPIISITEIIVSLNYLVINSPLRISLIQALAISNIFLIASLGFILISIIPIDLTIEETTQIPIDLTIEETTQIPKGKGKAKSKKGKKKSEEVKPKGVLSRLNINRRIHLLRYNSKAEYIQKMEKGNFRKVWYLVEGMSLLIAGFTITVLLLYYILSTTSILTSFLFIRSL